MVCPMCKSEMEVLVSAISSIDRPFYIPPKNLSKNHDASDVESWEEDYDYMHEEVGDEAEEAEAEHEEEEEEEEEEDDENVENEDENFGTVYPSAPLAVLRTA